MSEMVHIPCQLRYNLVWVYRDLVDMRLANRIKHRDTCFSFWQILEGKVRISGAMEEVVLGAGSYVFLSPDMMRTQRFEKGTRILSIRFYGEEPSLIRFAEPGFHFFSTVPAASFGGSSNALQKAWADFAGNGRGNRSVAAALQLQQRFLHWLNEWYKICTPFIRPSPALTLEEPRVTAMQEVLNQQTGLVPDYAVLSSVSGLSRSQTDRLFKVHGLGSPHQICERRTLRNAEKLLLNSQLPMKAIAADLGFFDASHFTRWFKKQTGVTPRVFRLRPLW